MLIAESEDARPKEKVAILWTKAMPLYDASGNIIGAIESLRDITEFRTLDRARRREKEVSRKSGAKGQGTLLVFSIRSPGNRRMPG